MSRAQAIKDGNFYNITDDDGGEIRLELGTAKKIAKEILKQCKRK